MIPERLPGRVYQAVPGFEDHLSCELGTLGHERQEYAPFNELKGAGLYYAACDPSLPVFWARNIWREPFLLNFATISEAAGALRAIQRNWAPVLCTQFRRGALIAAKLPPLPEKRRPFPWLLPKEPMGAWTLLDPHTLLGSAAPDNPFPGGVIEFEEDREGPPSRAYLKLWEALVRARRWPVPGERCLDAGASPGGWTWALAKLGAEVLSVDRAPLEPRVEAMPGVRYQRHDAFTLSPGDLGPLDWVFCDVACYPQRLFGWVEKMLGSGLCRNFVCTIKMQGGPPSGPLGGGDFDTPRRFAALPGGQVLHLYHNKHELTWIRIQ